MSLELVETIREVRDRVELVRRDGLSVGLVATMGALHAGHARLVEQARRDSGLVIVSIFVNPTQFGPHEDYARYPRTLASDRELCAQAGADLIFAPEPSTIYPPGPPSAYVEVPGLSEILEGAIRPQHFRGVATVVLKLMGIVRPDVAYFGQKDYQQQLVLRRMAADLNLPVAIVTVPTIREPDGLAMSSRNRYLNPAERQAARILSIALNQAVTAVKEGERSADRVRQILTRTVQSEGLASLDYAEVANAATLEPLNDLKPGQGAVALLAARVGPARLIDNAILLD